MTHPLIERAKLITRAADLGVYPNPAQHTDQQLRDAIAAEEAAIEWERQYDALPNDEARAAALRKLMESFRQ